RPEVLGARPQGDRVGGAVLCRWQDLPGHRKRRLIQFPRRQGEEGAGHPHHRHGPAGKEHGGGRGRSAVRTDGFVPLCDCKQVMAVQAHDLWSLVLDRQWVDPTELADAIVEQVGSNELDYRTRLLIRDSLDALRSYWGPARLQDWLDRSPARQTIDSI